MTGGDFRQPAGPGVYDRLADAFLHGRLHLDVRPPPGLLALHNPYDPAQNEPFRHYPWEDLSLRHGRLYAYWGPVPALVLFAPLRLLGWTGFPEAGAALLFSVGALVMATLLVLEVTRRWLPGLDRWLVAVAVLAVGTCNGVVLLLAPGHVWQVASAAGACFLLAALVLALRAAHRPSLGTVAAASLSLGLAVASRWSLAPVCAAWIAVFVFLRRQPGARPSTRPLAAAMFVPLGLCLVALAIYNAVRFGSPLETGLRLQVTAVNWHDQGLVQPHVLPVGLLYFVLFPFLIRPLFPYVWQNTTEVSPGTFQHVEPMVGLIWAAPILLALLAAPFVLRGRPDLRRLVGLTTATGVVMLVIVASIPATAMRYDADYATLLLLGALVVWLHATRSDRVRRRARRATLAVGVTACILGALVSVALSMSAGNVLRIGSPRTFSRIETFFAPVPSLASRIAGRPLLASVESFPLLPPRRPGMDSDSIGVSDELHVEVVSGRSGAAGSLVARVSPVGGASRLRVRSAEGVTDEVPADGAVHAIGLRLDSGINHVLVTRVTIGPPAPAAYVLLDGLRVDGG